MFPMTCLITEEIAAPMIVAPTIIAAAAEESLSLGWADFPVVSSSLSSPLTLSLEVPTASCTLVASDETASTLADWCDDDSILSEDEGDVNDDNAVVERSQVRACAHYKKGHRALQKGASRITKRGIAHYKNGVCA